MLQGKAKAEPLSWSPWNSTPESAQRGSSIFVLYLCVPSLQSWGIWGHFLLAESALGWVWTWEGSRESPGVDDSSFAYGINWEGETA